MKARFAKLLVFLLLGAIVNVAVAWGNIHFSNVDAYTSVSQEMTTFNANREQWRASTEWSLDEIRWRQSIESPPKSDHEERLYAWSGRGYAVLQFHTFPKTFLQMGFVSNMGSAAHARIWAGWPMYSLHANAKYDAEAHTVVDSNRCEYQYQGGFVFSTFDETSGYFNYFVLPFLPIWPAFAINTIFYASLLWVAFFAPGIAKRTLRRRRGLCPACAYPVGTSPVCTECGKPVKVQASIHQTTNGRQLDGT